MRRWAWAGFAAAAVPIIGLFDVWTGDELGFEPFYMIPVLLTSWFAGRNAGFALAILCTITEVLADDVLSGHVFHASWTPWWNAAVWLAVYGFVVYAASALHAKQTRLEQAMAEIRTLEGLLPICAWCKRIRDEGDWKPVEQYVTEHSQAEFTHGICPDCARTMRAQP